MKKHGEWIIIHPTDCFTTFPLYECSICENIANGLIPQYCSHCGAINIIAKNKFVKRAIFAPADPMALESEAKRS